MPEVVTAARPVPRDFNADQLPLMRAWLTANGIDPARVLTVEMLTVDAPIIAVTRKLVDGEGRTLVDGSTGCIASETTDYLLRVPPPEFWQPRQPD